MTHQYYDQKGIAKMREMEKGNGLEITYVVYLVDPVGDEFFINQGDQAVRVNTLSDQEPLVVKTMFQINAQLNRLREKYPPGYRLFALEYGEFVERKDQLRNLPSN